VALDFEVIDCLFFFAMAPNDHFRNNLDYNLLQELIEEDDFLFNQFLHIEANEIEAEVIHRLVCLSLGK
jgi:hypothetical protein